MAQNAPMTRYRDEAVAVYEQEKSVFAMGSTTVFQRMGDGSTITFLTAGSGSATATTRGLNGLIPARADALTQLSGTLVEYHDLVERTGFNIFESQGDARQIMLRTSPGVIHRKLDDILITALSAGTQEVGASGSSPTANVKMFMEARAKLGEADVDVTRDVYCAITPRAMGWMMQMTEFASKDYVNFSPFAGKKMMGFNWAGINFFESNRLSGRATANEKLLMWHKSAMGYAAESLDVQMFTGHDEKQDLYWTRTSAKACAKLLQNTGIVVLYHDGLAT